MTNRDDTVTAHLLRIGDFPRSHHGPPVGRAPDSVPDQYTLAGCRWPAFAPTAAAIEVR